MLPFKHSMVKLTDIPEIAERYASYINANYINVRIFSIYESIDLSKWRQREEIIYCNNGSIGKHCAKFVANDYGKWSLSHYYALSWIWNWQGINYFIQFIFIRKCAPIISFQLMTVQKSFHLVMYLLVFFCKKKNIPA